MEADSPPPGPRKTRRTANACNPCRQSKIKCSGKDPCQNCQRRAVRCHFSESDKKVVVTEKYLQDLQKRAETSRSPPVTTATSTSASTAASTASHDQEMRSGSQQSGINAHPQFPESRPTTHAFNMSPMSQSSRQGASPTGHNRKTFGINGIALVDPSIDTTLKLPMVSPTAQFPQHGTRPGSYAGTTPLSPRTSFPHPNAAMTNTVTGSTSEPTPSHCHPATAPLTNIWSSTFTIPAKTIRNTQNNKRTWIWLAPWSTWSFTIRLTLMLSDTLYPDNPPLPPSLVGTETYVLEYKTNASVVEPDFADLPSLNHALYLFNAVKFHLGQTYRLYDEVEFENEIREFYPNAHSMATERPLWFSKFLLILAFGTAFHSPPHDSPDPPGSKFFIRAMAITPNSNTLWKDSFLAMEVMALSGLYLYCIDHREGANIFLGHAIRIAQLEGMHTHIPEHEVGSNVAAYARDLWWTLYIMDRHFSSSVGLPMSMQDSDITTPVNPPGLGSAVDTARSLQVNLSHLMSVILTTVYKPDVTELAIFLEQTRSILHTLAHHAQEIEKMVGVEPRQSAGTIPRDTRLLTLLYHQCVIFATRPLLLSVMKERLSLLGCEGDENWTDFLAQTGSVISTGIKSAVKTLEILTSEYSVLDSFLPYDVEFTFGAALNLTMAGALFPDVADFNSCQEMAHQILNDLVYRGNHVAQARRSELRFLERLCSELIARGQQKGFRTLHLIRPDQQGTTPGRHVGGEYEAGTEARSSTTFVDANESIHVGFHGQPTSDTDFLDDMGISSEEFLSLVQQMGDPESLPDNMLTLC